MSFYKREYFAPLVIGVELSADFAHHIAKYEYALEKHFSKLHTLNCAIAGKVISRWEWLQFRERRDYYTSPLYKALS